MNTYIPSNATIQRGTTLVELLTFASILVTSLGIAVPSLAGIVQNSRIKSTSQMLNTNLMLARNYALTNRTRVIVCHASSPSQEACSEQRKRNTSWQNGVITYADRNANNELDADDHIISKMSISKNVSIVFNQNGRLRFFSDGSARSAGFYICNQAAQHQRHILILYSGRTRTMNTMSKKQEQTCLEQS